MLTLLYTACKRERYQLRMRAISRSKHTKLKNTKIYSKGVLVNHMKISTNKNFPLYQRCTSNITLRMIIILNDIVAKNQKFILTLDIT